MYCPKCNKNYTDEITFCPDCNVSLIEHSTEDGNISENTQPIKIGSFSNAIDAGIIMELLADNQIPCYKKSQGAGGYMNIYMGYSVFGEDIYVSQKDYQRAKELISNLMPQEEATEPEETNEVYTVPFYKKPKFVARIIIIASLVTAILCYILGKIS